MYMPYSRRPSECAVPISNSTVSGHAIVSINGDSSPTFVNSPVNWNNFATLDVFVKDDVLRGKSLFFTTIWQGCRFVPYTSSETKPQMVPMDLHIGFQGLALIQGQIYNPGWENVFLVYLFHPHRVESQI